MKKIIMSIFFLIILSNIYAEDKTHSERVYSFKVIAFHQEYEIFCTKVAIGYYKYPQEVNNETIYLTYETDKFFNQCKFDENFFIHDLFYPLNMWANNRGEVLRFKKRYSPVIDKDRERKNYPYGFGKN